MVVIWWYYAYKQGIKQRVTSSNPETMVLMSEKSWDLVLNS